MAPSTISTRSASQFNSRRKKIIFKMYGAKLTLRLARNRGTNWNFFNRYFSSSSSEAENYHIVLNNRPGVDGIPTAENFRCEKTLTPTKDDLTEGKLVVKSLYISTDPALVIIINFNVFFNH